jgi:SPP1 gp7 family putative phage head morphogenesis protein
MELADLLAMQDVELSRLSTSEGKAALKLYKQARGELRDRLDSLPAGKFQAQQFRVALVQVQEAIFHLGHSLNVRLRSAADKAAALSHENLIRQATAFSKKKYKGSLVPSPLTLAAAMDQGRTLLLPQFDSSVKRYGQKLIGDIQHRLAVSMAAHETTDQMRKRIFTDYLQPLGTVQVGGRDVPVTAGWAERLVRSEVSQAYNAFHHAQLSEQAYEEPSLMKCWSATMERRTCSICRAMNGKVLPVRQPFKLPNGKRVMHPIIHPNCSCTLVAWMPEWGDPRKLGVGETEVRYSSGPQPIITGERARALLPSASPTREGLPEGISNRHSEDQWAKHFEGGAPRGGAGPDAYWNPDAIVKYEPAAARAMARGRVLLERGYDMDVTKAVALLRLLPSPTVYRETIEELQKVIDEHPKGTRATMLDAMTSARESKNHSFSAQVKAMSALAAKIDVVGNKAPPQKSQGVQLKFFGGGPSAKLQKDVAEDARKFYWHLHGKKIGVPADTKLEYSMTDDDDHLYHPNGRLRTYKRDEVDKESTAQEFVQRVKWLPEGSSLSEFDARTWRISLVSHRSRAEAALILVHEMAHAVDHRSMESYEAVVSFLRSRVSRTPGGDPVLMSEEAIKKRWKNRMEGVQIWDDTFLSVYTGRAYGHHFEDSEVLSMGVESVFAAPALTMAYDEHLFLLALGALR